MNSVPLILVPSENGVNGENARPLTTAVEKELENETDRVLQLTEKLSSEMMLIPPGLHSTPTNGSLMALTLLILPASVEMEIWKNSEIASLVVNTPNGQHGEPMEMETPASSPVTGTGPTLTAEKPHQHALPAVKITVVPDSELVGLLVVKTMTIAAIKFTKKNASFHTAPAGKNGDHGHPVLCPAVLV